MQRRRHGWLLAFGLATCGIAGLAIAQVRGQSSSVEQATIGSGSAIIRGRVQIGDRLATPVRRARVTLTAAAGQSYTTDTDTDGRYQFDRLAAGPYQIQVSKAGFLPATARARRPEEPPTRVIVAAGQLVPLDLSLQRGAALVGRFVDEDGTPLAGMDVSADRVLDMGGARQLETHRVRTDDLGRFRVHTLPPGDYYVHGLPNPPWSRERFYYPAAARIEQAQAITLTPGQELDGLDVIVDRPPPPNPIVENPESTTTPQPPRRPDASRISGRVMRGDTSTPIEAAVVSLVAFAGLASPAVRTDARGRFEFSGMLAGQYTLIATADGFVNSEAALYRSTGATRTIELKERQQIDNADLLLVKPGAIEGRIIDEFGDPVPGVKVQFGQRVSSSGRSVLFTNTDTRSALTTDDLGTFRGTGLAPGDYYVFVFTGPFGRSGSSAFSSVDDGVVGFAPTYFPGTTNAGNATTVHLDAGKDTRDVTFALSPARMAVVSGTVNDAAGQPAPNARLMLLQVQAGDLRTMVSANTSAAPDGSFRYRNIPPGSYVLQAWYAPPPPGRPEFSSTPVTVPESDGGRGEGRVTVATRPFRTIRGHISFDGSASPPPKDLINLGFLPTDFVSGPAGGNAIPSHVDDDWNFDLGPLASTGIIRVLAPSAWIVKSVMLNGQDIADTPYDFQSADVNGIEIVLTSRVASVSGVVRDGDKPATRCTVIVFSDDSSKWQIPSRFMSGARCDPQGAFATPPLLPGRYLAIALADLPDDFTPARLATLRPAATPFSVSEGERANLTLKVR